MKKIIISLALSLVTMPFILAGGYNVGDKAADFKLPNIDGKYVSLSDYPDAKGFIVVFTCNGCPYARAYQDPAAVKEPYLANALNALLADREPDPSFTKAIGCTIKQQ
jgi:peroxiredoxin